MKKYFFIFFFIFIFSVEAKIDIVGRFGPYFDNTQLKLKKVKYTEEIYYINTNLNYNNDVYRSYNIERNINVLYYYYNSDPYLYDYYGKNLKKTYRSFGAYIGGEGLYDKWLALGFEGSFSNGNKKKDKYTSSMFELYLRLILFSQYKFNLYFGSSIGMKYINFSRLYRNYEKIEDIDRDGVFESVFYNYYMKAHATYFYESFNIGFIYNFDDNFSIDLNYKYVPKKTVKFDNDNVRELQSLKNLYEGDYKFDVYTSILSLGIRYIF